MAFTDRGTFVAWDPLRPLKTPLCLACGTPPKSPARCGGCHFAHFCDIECQHMGWAQHEPACERGYPAYIAAIEEHTQGVARLQREGAVSDQVLLQLEPGIAAWWLPDRHGAAARTYGLACPPPPHLATLL